MRICITKGPDKGQVFDLNDGAETVIGRDLECDVVIRDEGSSRRHARILQDDGTLHVEDLGSTNGTSVNGQAIRKRTLEPSDRIKIGGTILELVPSGMPAQLHATSLNLNSSTPSVEVTIHHEQADLLSDRTPRGDATSDEEERRVLRELCEIVQLVATEGETEAMLSTALNRVQDVLDSHVACILMRDGERPDYIVRAAAAADEDEAEITVSRSIVEATVREGVAILCQNTMEDERFDPGQSILMHGISSALCAPLKIDDDFCGALLVDRRGATRSFTQLDLRFAATVGNMLSVFLEKERLAAEARERERLAVIGEVMAGLAHYAKNILMGMKFSTATLKKVIDKQDFTSAGDSLQSIEAQQERISGLVLDMLSYAKDRKPEKTEVELAGVLDTVTLPFQRPLQEQGIEVVQEIDPATPTVHAEETSLHRVFLNLLGNAIDAVIAAPAGNEKKVLVTAVPTKARDGADIRFRDTGCGIPEDELAKIFQVFYSTKGSKGTGLGLAVVKKLIDEHGGSIDVDSKAGEWTEFRVVLPAGEA